MLNFPYILLTKLPKKELYKQYLKPEKSQSIKTFSRGEIWQNLKMTPRRKNHTHVMKVGHTSEFLFGIY